MNAPNAVEDRGDQGDLDPDDASPCIGICTADPESGLCLGCGTRLAPPAARTDALHAESPPAA